MKIIKFGIISIIIGFLCTLSLTSAPKIIKKDVWVSNGKIAIIYWVDFDNDGVWDCKYGYYDSRLVYKYCRQMSKESLTKDFSYNLHHQVILTSHELKFIDNDINHLLGSQILISDYNGIIWKKFVKEDISNSIQFPESLKSGIYIVTLFQNNSVIKSYKFLIN